jgi:hypothetical protein
MMVLVCDVALIVVSLLASKLTNPATNPSKQEQIRAEEVARWKAGGVGDRRPTQ